MIWITTQNQRFIDYAEITEYEGKNLSSINNFRENSIKGPQHIDNQTYKLEITGLVKNNQTYTYQQILNQYDSYKKVVTLNCVEGWKVTILWEGLQIKQMLANADVDPKATTVIFYAYDGYSTALPLDYIIDKIKEYYLK